MIEQVILHRLLTARERLWPYKRKALKLRRIVAGDRSIYAEDSWTTDQLSEIEPGAGRSWMCVESVYPILKTNFQEGQSNMMFKLIRSLLAQVAFRRPEVHFPSLDPTHGALMASYLEARLGPAPRGSGALELKRLQLQDELIHGLSALLHCMGEEGWPVIEKLDIMDCLWDYEADLVMQHRWRACVRSNPLEVWEDVFGKAAMKRHRDMERMDPHVELIYYWDLDGEAGHHAVIDPAFLHEGIDGDHFLAMDDNPYWTTIDGFRAPFLPIQMRAHHEMSGLFQPVGMSEMMLSHQIMYDSIQEDYVDKIRRSKGIDVLDPAAFDEQDLEKWLEGETTTLRLKKGIGLTQGGMPFMQLNPPRVDSATPQLMASERKEMVESSGVNPFSGGMNPDVDFAAQANQIASRGDTHAAELASRFAASWEESCRMMLAIGAQYDASPIRLVVDGEPIIFNTTPELMLAQILDPGADLVVREDTVTFEPKGTQVSRLRAILGDWMGVSQALGLGPEQGLKIWERLMSLNGFTPGASGDAAPMMAAPGGPENA